MRATRTRGVHVAWWRWLATHRGAAARDDSGQALWLAIILVVILGLLGPLMAFQVTGDTPLLIASTNKHAALAAAEAGIQWYRDNLDSYSLYYEYTASNNAESDPALSGWCGAGLASTCGLAGTNPSEAFTYVPDDSCLFESSGQKNSEGSVCGAAAGTVVLTVTGRAGGPGHYDYVVTQTSFTASSVLDDAYFSNYEVLDPNSDTIQGTDVTVTTGGTTTNQSITSTSLPVNYTYTTSAGSVSVSDQDVWQAACEYETYDPNTFIDSLGLKINGVTYSSSYPYYGPYQSQQSFSFDEDGQNNVSATGATQITVPSLGCGDPYDWVNGEVFSGPVYTNDQLHICGSPTFDGSPVSLISGAPSGDPYVWDVPGSVKIGSSYYPAGYTEDTVNCSGGPITPTLAHGVELNGTQGIPQLNTELAEYATNSPPAGTGTGCTYTGPTMIELVTSGGTTTMNVWSPLSSSPTTTSTCSNGGTFSASNPFITGIALPTDGVVYVQSYTPGTTLPTVPSDGPGMGGTNPTNCFNPYLYNDSPSLASCYEGDVYIEGELHGQLTVASAANILITRDLTYYCVDGSGGAVNTDPSTVTNCTNSATPDILGLSAADDVLISANDPSQTPSSDAHCTYDGTGTPPSSGVTISGTLYSNNDDPEGVWPWLCNAGTSTAGGSGNPGVIVDAAVLATQGSFGDENWGTTAYSGDVYLEGTDLSDFRGPFGYSPAVSGYYKEFSYDARLAYVTPPDVLPNGIPVWQVGNYIVCENSSTLGTKQDEGQAYLSCPAP